jgi:hypothetical protein
VKEGASWLYEGHIYLGEIWTEAELHIFRHFVWFKYVTYQLVLIRLRSISSTFCCRLKLASFLCRNTPTNKNKVALLSQLYYFRSIMPTKGTIVLCAVYSFTGLVFRTISLLAL